MLYCAYGSNLHPDRLGRRIASPTLVATASLPGWALRFNKRSVIDGSAKANIIAAIDDPPACAAIYELTPGDLERLDEIEGLGNGYAHESIGLPGFGEVLAYVAQPGHVDDRLRPFGWYKEYVLAGCRYHGFDAGYVDAIRRVPHCDDSLRARHEKHMNEIAGMHRFSPDGTA